MFARGKNRVQELLRRGNVRGCHAPWGARIPCSRLWNRLSRRGPLRTWSKNSHHDARRIGIALRRRNDDHRSEQQRPEISSYALRILGRAATYLAAVLFCGFLVGCGFRSRPAPADLFLEVQNDARHGKIDVALRKADRAYAEYHRTGNEEWEWSFRVLKAQVLIFRASYKEALDLAGAPIPDRFATTETAARRKLVQGLAHDYLQNYDESEKDLSEAERLAAPFPSLLGQVVQARGNLALDQSKFEEAETQFQSALQLARQNHLPFLENDITGSLGNVAMSEQHYDQAVDRYRSSLELSRSRGADAATAITLGNIGWSYRELGDFENALTYYKQAEEASAHSGLAGERLYWKTGIAKVYYKQHDYASAEAVLTQGLDLARKQDDKSTLTEYLNDLAEVALETGKTERAENYFEEASAAEQTGQDPFAILATVLIGGRISENKGDHRSAESSLLRVIRDPSATSAQRWEAESRLASIYAKENLDAKAEQEFRHSLNTIENARRAVQAVDLRLSFLSGAISFYDDYVGFLISRHHTKDALQVAELSRARTLGEGLGAAGPVSFPLSNFHPEELARRSHAVLLFYWLGRPTSYVWVITPVKVTCLTLPSAAEIDPLVKAYRDAVLSGRDVLQASNPDGAKLYSLLVGPAKELIPRDSRMIVLPDGSLYGLNFETLLVPSATPHFWIEDVTVTTVSSLALLLAANARPSPKEGRLLLVGNTAPAGPEFPVLRQAGAEIQRVQQYFPEPRREVLTGANATPSAVLSSEPGKFAYVHFVTHGTASRAHPLDSQAVRYSECPAGLPDCSVADPAAAAPADRDG